MALWPSRTVVVLETLERWEAPRGDGVPLCSNGSGTKPKSSLGPMEER